MAKYCTICGNELFDEAVVCPRCGCLAPNNNAQNPQNPQNNGTSNKFQISIILGIIGIVFSCLYALFGHIASIVGIVLGVKEKKETGSSLGLILSIIGEACSILSSVLGILLILSLF